jgi:hypothetical protein
MDHTRSEPLSKLVSVAASMLCCLGCGDDQTTLSRAELLDPMTCQRCHADHFRDWSGSMHAYASDDPLFIAMNQRGQRETSGMLGDFCVNCHAPMAVHEGATQNGLNLAQVPQALKGVTCFFCHTVDAVTGTHNNPLHLASDGVTMRGEYSDPVKNVAHKATYSTLHDRDQSDSASLCGSCHDIVTPAGAAIERTFTEWHNSVFSQIRGNSCSQCHMAQSAHDQPIAMAPGVFARRYHSHEFPAVDTALVDGFPQAAEQAQAVKDFLNTALQSALCVVDYGNAASLRVILDDVAAGHSFPSGAAQDRRFWAEVMAYQGTQVVYQSGVVADGMVPTQNPDADFWMLRDCMLDAQMRPVSMFWQAQSYDSNLLPAQLTANALDPRFYQSHVMQSFPRATGAHVSPKPDRVTLRLRLQPVGLDVIDDLVASRDLDASVRARIPTYDLDLGGGATLEWTPAAATFGWMEQDIYPVTCVSHTNLNFGAQKVAASNHMSCAP